MLLYSTNLLKIERCRFYMRMKRTLIYGCLISIASQTAGSAAEFDKIQFEQSVDKQTFPAIDRLGSATLQLSNEEYIKHDTGVPNIYVQTDRLITDRLEPNKIIPEPLPPIEYFETWVKVANCESRLKWALDTGNGFEGGLQFTETSWEGAGGLKYAPSPKLATPAEQMVTAEVLLDLQGPNAWPFCGKYFNGVL